MTKPNEQTRPQELKTPLYKRAALPWALIIATALFVSGVMAGWVWRSGQVTMNDVTAAIAQAQTAKK